MSAAAPAVSLSTAAYTVPTDQPEADGTLAWDSTTLVVVEARAAGCVGTGCTYAPRAAAGVVEDLLAPVLDDPGPAGGLADVLSGDGAGDGPDGGDADAACAAVEAVWEAMVRAVRNAGRGGLVGMALSAVDIALWDLVARVRGLPLVEVWGGAAEAVPVYGSGGFTTYDEARLRAQVDGWLELGCDLVKIKIGESWGTRVSRDLERVGTATSAAGGSARVMVDANGGYDVAQACAVGAALDDLGVVWFEEPVTSEDPQGLRVVRDHVAADVAAGEYAADEADLARLAPCVDCLQIDVTRCGGYTGWRRATRRVRTGPPLSGHCAPYLSLPVAATTPRLRHLEFFHDHVRIEQRLLEGTPRPVDGRLPVPDGPGHGLVFRTDDAEEYRVA